MKYSLYMIICSLVAGECMPPFKMPDQHNTMYDCLHAGYIESKSKLEEIVRSDVNQHQMYIKFLCKSEEEIIIPPPKPKGDPV